MKRVQQKYHFETGQRFGRGVVLNPAEVRVPVKYPSHPRQRTEAYVRMVCDCGTEYMGTRSQIATGWIQSCGCLKRENARTKNIVLTNEQVTEIRKRHANGESNAQLGKEYGVTRATIRRIVIGETWREHER